MGGETRREKSLRIGVHHANAVVWGLVYRTHLTPHSVPLPTVVTSRRCRRMDCASSSPSCTGSPSRKSRNFSTALKLPLFTTHPATMFALFPRRPLRSKTCRTSASPKTSSCRRSGAEGRCSARSDGGVESKGVRSGAERRRGVSGLKPWDPGRRDAPGDKVLEKRRSARERGRTGTSVRRTRLSRPRARRRRRGGGR